MEKELENLLDNYENVIYGQVFTITPSIHQLHLLLDYIANLEQQCKKQKEVIDKVAEKIKDYKIYCEKNKGFTEYTDIEIEAIEPVISKLEDILQEEK
jgi:hypothetical protein